MDKKYNKEIHFRVTEKEKLKLQQRAKKCNLPVSEYIRKLALSYEPKEYHSDRFYEFYGELNKLCDICADRITPKVEGRLLSVIDEILKMLSESPQSLLCGEKEQPRNTEPICINADSE